MTDAHEPLPQFLYWTCPCCHRVTLKLETIQPEDGTVTFALRQVESWIEDLGPDAVFSSP